MTRVNRATERKAYAPRFPKPKDEGWFLTLGHVDSIELLALKRVPFIQNTSHQLIAFSTPLKPGKLIIYCFSLTYYYQLGLDITQVLSSTEFVCY